MRKDIHTNGIPVLCVSCEARHRGVCGALEPVQLLALAKQSRIWRAERGTELISDAKQIDSYANVLSGVVKLTKTLSDGRQQIVGLQFAPDFLGRPFSSENQLKAEAATMVSLCSFPRRAIEQIMETSPELERRLYRQALNELDEARDWMVTLGRKTASERIASFILLIARHEQPANANQAKTVQFELPLTRADIADFLGLTLETVSRQISILRREQLISIENSRFVTVPDLDRLAARAGD